MGSSKEIKDHDKTIILRKLFKKNPKINAPHLTKHSAMANVKKMHRETAHRIILQSACFGGRIVKNTSSQNKNLSFHLQTNKISLDFNQNILTRKLTLEKQCYLLMRASVIYFVIMVM